MAWDPGFNVAFNPRSVAVLGASTQERGGGNQFIRGMQEMKYEGAIYPINPHADEILGLKCYPSLAAVPEVPDLVIMAVGAGRAEDALEECIAKGARNIHMFTAGFAETGEEEGAQLADRLRAVAKRGKLSGGKHFLRCRACGAERVIPLDRPYGDCEACGGAMGQLLAPVLRAGELLAPPEPPRRLRERVLAQLHRVGLDAAG